MCLYLTSKDNRRAAPIAISWIQMSNNSLPIKILKVYKHKKLDILILIFIFQYIKHVIIILMCQLLFGNNTDKYFQCIQ